MSLLSVALIVFILNIPFGYWRANTRKFSLQWILAIHLPVPLVVALRLYAHLGWHLVTFPVLIGAFFSGQIVGAKLFVVFSKYLEENTSCLFVDIYQLTTLSRTKDL